MAEVVKNWWNLEDLNNKKIYQWVVDIFGRSGFSQLQKVGNWDGEPCKAIRGELDRLPPFSNSSMDIAGIAGRRIVCAQIHITGARATRGVLDDIKGYARVGKDGVRLETRVLAMDKLPQVDGPLDYWKLVAIRRKPRQL